MTISKRVQKELYSAAPAGVLPPLAVVTAAQQPMVRTKGKRSAAARGPKKTKSERALTAALAAESKGKAWTDAEHARFLEALRVYPSGPWKAIADFVGTKNSRQTMTHAQKYRQKHERRERGLRNRTKHRKAARALVESQPPAAATAAATATAATRLASVTTRSQTSAKRVPRHAALVIPTTLRMSAASHATESPRSGEESTATNSSAGNNNSSTGSAYIESLAVEALMASVDADAFDDGASWEQLKVASFSEMFQDFEPMHLLPTMWSTTSLGDIDVAPPVTHSISSLGASNELFSDSNSATNPLWG